MSITVRTENGIDNYAKATRWDVTEHGGLWVIAVDTVIAEYPPGAWFIITRDDEAQEEPQGGEKDDGVMNFLLPTSTAYRVMINGTPFNIWSYDYRHADGTATLHARIDR